MCCTDAVCIHCNKEGKTFQRKTKWADYTEGDRSDSSRIRLFSNRRESGQGAGNHHYQTGRTRSHAVRGRRGAETDRGGGKNGDFAVDYCPAPFLWSGKYRPRPRRSGTMLRSTSTPRTGTEKHRRTTSRKTGKEVGMPNQDRIGSNGQNDPAAAAILSKFVDHSSPAKAETTYLLSHFRGL